MRLNVRHCSCCLSSTRLVVSGEAHMSKRGKSVATTFMCASVAVILACAAAGGPQKITEVLHDVHGDSAVWNQPWGLQGVAVHLGGSGEEACHGAVVLRELAPFKLEMAACCAASMPPPDYKSLETAQNVLTPSNQST